MNLQSKWILNPFWDYSLFDLLHTWLHTLFSDFSGHQVLHAYFFCHIYLIMIFEKKYFKKYFHLLYKKNAIDFVSWIRSIFLGDQLRSDRRKSALHCFFHCWFQKWGNGDIFHPSKDLLAIAQLHLFEFLKFLGLNLIVFLPGVTKLQSSSCNIPFDM